MSTGKKISIAAARACADELLALLRPACVKIRIAGSIRRKVPFVGDIELLALPETRRATAQPTLFGPPTEEAPPVSCLWELLDRLVATHPHLERHPEITTRSGDLRKAAWGTRYRKLLWHGVPVDLFTATRDTWGAQFLIRTGPSTFSQWWVTALKSESLRMSGGRVLGGDTVVSVPTELEAFALVGVRYQDPPDRKAIGRSWRR